MDALFPTRHAGSDLLQIARASRARKIVPLILLVLNAALLPKRPLDWSLLATAGLYVFIISIFGMQLNVITDVELDKATKPELAEQLCGNMPLLRLLFRVEVLAIVASLGVVASHGRWQVVVALVAYGSFFTCYSYNVLVPRRAAAYRLKAYWWGNALVGLGGYFALWVVGLSCAQVSRAALPQWLFVAAAASFLDYGVFLVECAQDAPEERAHRLSTLPALLGRRGTLFGAALLVVGGAFGILWFSRFVHAAGKAALFWVLAVQVSAAFASALRTRDGAERTRRWEKLVDLSFWTARLGMSSILLTSWVLT
jgi:1,4-dihydroxy-2-naphthoate octaprenyltransferase